MDGALAFRDLLGLSMSSVNRIVVEDDGERFVLDDSFALSTNGGLFQIMNSDNTCTLSRINKPWDLTTWATFNKKKMEVSFDEICELTVVVPIREVVHYRKGGYLFGTKCLGKGGMFIIGFCYGFDEIQLQDEAQFAALLVQYTENVDVEVLDEQMPG